MDANQTIPLATFLLLQVRPVCGLCEIDLGVAFSYSQFLRHTGSALALLRLPFPQSIFFATTRCLQERPATATAPCATSAAACDSRSAQQDLAGILHPTPSLLEIRTLFNK